MSQVTIPQPNLEHDKILVFWKIGDQSIHGARDFELLGYIDPDEWTIDGQPVISDHMATVYGIALVTKDFKPIVQEKVAMNNEWKTSGCDIYDTVWRDVNTDFVVWTSATSGSDLYEMIETSAGIEYINVSAISGDETYYTSAIEVSAVPTSSWEVVGWEDQRVQKRWCLDKAKMTREGLLDALYAKDVVVPILDGFEVSAGPDWLIEKDFTGLELIADSNAITSGSYTIGSGGDYTTCNLFEADLATLTNNISGVYISDVTETTDTTFNTDFGPYTLRVTSNDINNVVTFNTNKEFTISPTVSGGGIEIDSFKCVSGGARIIQCVTLTSATDISIHGLYIDNGDGGGYPIYIYNALATAKIFNNVIYNGETGARLLYVRNATTDSIIENNTIDARNSTYGIVCASLGIIVRNNVVFGSDVWDFIQITSTFGYNNADSDATGEDADFGAGGEGGEGNISNINPEAEFKSLDPSSSDFLKPKTYSILNHKGASILTANTTGIRGNDRPHTRT